MLVGYARISTPSQCFDLQLDALEVAGCEKIFSDTLSGSIDDRKGLMEALRSLRKGDVLVVWKLDRLGRSLPHLVKTVSELNRRGIDLKSLTENLDTTSPGGRLLFNIMACLASFESDLIRERTRAGLDAARAKNRVGGRPSKLDPQKVATAKRLLADPEMRAEDVCIALGVSKSTLYRGLQTLKK